MKYDAKEFKQYPEVMNKEQMRMRFCSSSGGSGRTYSTVRTIVKVATVVPSELLFI